MIQEIGCTLCNKTGMLPISFKFLSEANNCGKCKQTHTVEWRYYFCSTECFIKWFEDNEIAEKGFPCQSCQGSEDNKKCKRCKGKGRVSETKTNFKKVAELDVPVEFYIVDSVSGKPIFAKGK